MSLVIFTEEPSMKEALQLILPRIGIDRRCFRIISFDGCGNMEKSLPTQLEALSRDDSNKILILRDNDNGCCQTHKTGLSNMTRAANIDERSKIRIVCQMLEARFIGDSNALSASRHLQKPVPKRLTRCDPDQLLNPKGELRKLRDGYTEITGARAIAPHITVEANRSKSFRHTIQAIRDLTQA